MERGEKKGRDWIRVLTLSVLSHEKIVGFVGMLVNGMGLGLMLRMACWFDFMNNKCVCL